MKKIFLIFFTLKALFGAVHIVKVEPFEIYHIKAATSGQVVNSDISKESKVVNNYEIIKLDSNVEEENLKDLILKLKNTKEILKSNKELLKNLKKLTDVKKDNYFRIKDLKTKSKFEKDAKLTDYLQTYNQYLSQKEKIKSLLNQISDLKYNIARLKDTLSKKSIKVSGYVYKIYVKRGDFVNLGSPLVDIADISKAKIVLYLDKNEMKDIEKKSIYIDGKKSNLKFYKLYKIADSVHITAYRAEIVLKSPKLFSKLIKVEVK